jgi:hypothetical protein
MPPSCAAAAVATSAAVTGASALAATEVRALKFAAAAAGLDDSTVTIHVKPVVAPSRRRVAPAQGAPDAVTVT